MIAVNEHFSLWENLSPDQVAPTMSAFLKQLGGPSILKISGRDRTRCRVVVTLLHGNEPSGLKAIHRLLLDGYVPEVNVLIAIVSVEAALTEPLFTHRFLPEQHDMNRLFQAPYVGKQAALAKALLDIIRETKPEAVIDIHNTSGNGPAFAVCVGQHTKYLDLAALFTHRLIITGHRLGALMEVDDLGCPILTVECGGSMQTESDIVALNGLKKLFSHHQLYQSVERAEMDMYLNPVRLELCEKGVLCYAGEQQPDADVTVPLHIDRRNFGVVRPDMALAWLGSRGIDSLCLFDEQGQNVIDEFFVVKDSKLYPRTTLKLFMATTNSNIAMNDCLLYAVKERDHLWDETSDDTSAWC